ncbi:MAG TPA: DNA-processing protein DprA [Terrimicrobiaceae bacterium]|nr:DNA-processing protein DprA [Terrimicrobiaceae bacterium]
MTQTEAFVALNMLPRIGPVRVRKLLEVFGSPQAIFEAKPRDLRHVQGIGPEVAESVASWQATCDLASELERARTFGAGIISQADPAYPTLLKEIHDPPIVLYVWGELRDPHAIGIVGTRKPSHYAAECTKKLAYQLAYAGITVVSGLARGVDTAAHQAALAAKGRTIAVLGSGLEALYPPENRELAERISGSGAVVTEFPMTTVADRQTFPMRNRIISGVSAGLLVVEAGAASGALISATQAADQGRSIYAVPGRIDHPGAIGSNRLIQQGAKLVASAQDILDDFGLLFPETPNLARPVTELNLTPAERSVHESIGDEETPIDTIIAKCGLPTHEVSSTLLALEMRKLVKQLPGSRFVKIQ